MILIEPFIFLIISNVNFINSNYFLPDNQPSVSRFKLLHKAEMFTACTHLIYSFNDQDSKNHASFLDQ